MDRILTDEEIAAVHAVPAGRSLIDLSPICDSFKSSTPVHRRYFVPKSFDVQRNIGPVLHPVQDADVHVQESPSNEYRGVRFRFPLGG
jgi:hypothetical protein